MLGDERWLEKLSLEPLLLLHAARAQPAQLTIGSHRNLERMVRGCQTLTLALCAACATGGKARVTTDDVRVVDSLFAAYTGSAVPGASVVVVQNGQVVVRRAYGMADLERGIAAAP